MSPSGGNSHESGIGGAESDDLRVCRAQAQRQVARDVEDHRHLDARTPCKKAAQLFLGERQYPRVDDSSTCTAPSSGTKRQSLAIPSLTTTSSTACGRCSPMASRVCSSSLDRPTSCGDPVRAGFSIIGNGFRGVFWTMRERSNIDGAEVDRQARKQRKRLRILNLPRFAPAPGQPGRRLLLTFRICRRRRQRLGFSRWRRPMGTRIAPSFSSSSSTLLRRSGWLVITPWTPI